MPTVSIITATYRRPEKLKNALKAVLDQDSPNWEYLISPDDGVDYTDFGSIDARIRVLPPGPIATGPGPTRNRALAQASGQFVAVLDDDDHISANFVSAILEMVDRHGTCAIPTTYLGGDGQIIRSIGKDIDSMDIPEFSRLLCSMHHAGPRETYPLWPSCFAEDVVHTCAGIDLAGGRIQICRDADYFCNTSSDSMCGSNANIKDDYEKAIRLSPWGRDKRYAVEVENLFKHRIAADQKYSDNGANMSYHEYFKDSSNL